MQTFRKIAGWLLVLILLGCATGGAYAWHLWNHSDEVLRQLVLAKLHEFAPDWQVEFQRAQFDFQGRVRLYNLTLKTPGPDNPDLIAVPEIIVVIDPERLTERHPPIQQIRLLRPHVQLARSAAGAWNWRQLPPRPHLDGTIAEWQIEQATVTVRLDHDAGRTPVSLKLRDVDAQFVPSGKRQFQIRSEGKLDLADTFQGDGQWNLDTNLWSFSGEIRDFKVEQRVYDIAARLSPDAEKLLRRYGTRPRHTAGAAAGPPAASLTPGEPLPPAAISLGATATLDARFRVMQWQPDAELEYRAALHIEHGEVLNPWLPYPLYDLRGEVYLDNSQIVLRQFTGRNGATQMTLDGKVAGRGEVRPADLTIAVTDLAIDDRLRAWMTDDQRRVNDSLRLTGVIDGLWKLTYNGRDRWDRESTVTLKNCAAAYERFPYPVEQIQGTLKYRGEILDISVRGIAGQHPVTVTGRFRKPGPAAEAVLDIEVTGMRLDDKFRAACPLKVQKTLDAIRLQGRCSGHVQLVRPAGLNQKYSHVVAARLENCTLSARQFPYPVTNITGIVDGVGDRWIFTEMRGKHESTDLSATGSFGPDDLGAELLELKIQVAAADFDSQLQAALPENWQTVWKEFNPTGRVDAAIGVRWSPGLPPDVDLDARLSDAAFSLKSFPYPMQNVQGRVQVGGGKVTISGLSARHDETRFRMQGVGEFARDGEWRMRLDDVMVDDLDPDRRLRKALPARLREIIETLDPRHGKLSMSGMLEFRGTGRANDPVTAAWDLETVYSGASITAGVDLDNLHGRVGLRGTWDGERVVGDGRIDLDSLSFRGHQLTQVQGPVSVHGTQLVIGSMEAVHNSGPGGSAAARRLTARFIDGVLTLDGAAVLEGTTSYHVRMELSDGKLERYARLYLPGRQRLMGVMNGWLDLQGRGGSSKNLTGRGQLLVKPAALYELPVIVAIFKILSFVPPDKTAFQKALVDFDVGGGQFQFKRIDLTGDAVNLRGRGFIRFDGPLHLDFYSMIPRNQLPIPVVKELLTEFSKGWIGVEIRGTTSNPVATMRALPQMDDALRNFLGVFDNANAANPPRPRQ